MTEPYPGQAADVERRAERERQAMTRERRKIEFARTLFEYVTVFAGGPTHGDLDQWQLRLTELGEQLFDQAGP